MAKTLSADKLFVSDLRGCNPAYSNGVRRGLLQHACREWGRWRDFLDPTGVEQRIAAVAPRAPAGQGMPCNSEGGWCDRIDIQKIRPDQRADRLEEGLVRWRRWFSNKMSAFMEQAALANGNIMLEKLRGRVGDRLRKRIEAAGATEARNLIRSPRKDESTPESRRRVVFSKARNSA